MLREIFIPISAYITLAINKYNLIHNFVTYFPLEYIFVLYKVIH